MTFNNPDHVEALLERLTLALERIADHLEPEKPKAEAPAASQPAREDRMTKEELDALLATPSPEFDAWRNSMPDKYWATKDVSACKLGWMAARAAEATELMAAREALKPFARLEVPEKLRNGGNAGAYSILFDHIRAARAALELREKNRAAD